LFLGYQIGVERVIAWSEVPVLLGSLQTVGTDPKDGRGIALGRFAFNGSSGECEGWLEVFPYSFGIPRVCQLPAPQVQGLHVQRNSHLCHQAEDGRRTGRLCANGSRRSEPFKD
jgi:hypothetical protein